MHRIHLVAALIATGVLLAAPFAHGATASVVISQVYAGGGNSGATFTNDFVELFNRSGSAVDLTGWTLQYASASSTSWAATALSGSIQSGRYYLVQLASTAAVGAPLPTPEATGTSNLAASGGKVALVRDATPLTCGCGSVKVRAGLHYESPGTLRYEGDDPTLAAAFTSQRRVVVFTLGGSLFAEHFGNALRLDLDARDVLDGPDLSFGVVWRF